jgi:hydrogenase expression/formation protein HypE
MSTDSFVVSPLFFPGGDIGRLAVHGTINDLAVSGAEPMYLSLSLIIEEGLPLEMFRRVVHSIRETARACRVQVVTGDTKVVPCGAADGLFVNTTGIGRMRPGIDLGTHRVRPNDRVLVSGTIGDHGIAILSAREQLDLESELPSDTAPLHELVQALFDSGTDLHFVRDPTRGGVAGVLHELVEQTRLTMHLDESALPLSEAGRGASELFGLDPWHIANEGKLVVVVAEADAGRALQALWDHPLGRQAARIGWVGSDAKAHVLLNGALGTVRVLDEPSGAPLPRIC